MTEGIAHKQPTLWLLCAALVFGVLACPAAAPGQAGHPMDALTSSEVAREEREAIDEDAEDRIRMTVKMVPNGQHIRFEVEDAILKILTEIGQSMGGGFAPQDF